MRGSWASSGAEPCPNQSQGKRAVRIPADPHHRPVEFNSLDRITSDSCGLAFSEAAIPWRSPPSTLRQEAPGALTVAVTLHLGTAKFPMLLTPEETSGGLPFLLHPLTPMGATGSSGLFLLLPHPVPFPSQLFPNENPVRDLMLFEFAPRARRWLLLGLTEKEEDTGHSLPCHHHTGRLEGTLLGVDPAGIPPDARLAGPKPPRAPAQHLPPPASPLLSTAARPRCRFNPRGHPDRGSHSAPSLPPPLQSRPGRGHLRAATSPGRSRPADWACSGAGRPGAAGAKRMHSPRAARAVQGRSVQAAAVADALAGLGRTRARMASLSAYDKDVSCGSYNLSSATTGSYYSCVSQITIGYDVAGPVAIGLTHWKSPYSQGRPTLPSDLPLFISKDAGIPVYHRSFACKTDLATPLSCPASLSITPVPSYSSSSQETLSQDTTGKSMSFLRRFRPRCS
ncbi:uncharacterized protein [Dasypus novemcinctus]|uniref:uncharacterized protein n=1 Tax=Dasypus novemcinctus TaxID=9361 RepID=UPI00265D68F7|nr:uncharacterized protein LOC131280709 [Dasypus novemcinctus]